MLEKVVNHPWQGLEVLSLSVAEKVNPPCLPAHDPRKVLHAELFCIWYSDQICAFRRPKSTSGLPTPTLSRKLKRLVVV